LYAFIELNRNERKGELLELSLVMRASYHAEKEDYAVFLNSLEIDDG